MSDKKKEFYTARGYEIAADKGTLTPSMEDYIEPAFPEYCNDEKL